MATTGNLENKRVLGLFAHPDDAEFMCAGTLALLHQEGYDIHIATMTSGDCGSTELSREEISQIRRAEAGQSVKILHGTYHCLEFDDIFIFYERATLTRVIELLRRVQPLIVFAPSPMDYMVDHEMTSLLAQTACFSCGIYNISTAAVAPYDFIPYLYYVDPMEGKDKLGLAVKPSICVDISSVMAAKEQMLCCHASQRNWLLAHHGMDSYVDSMKKFAEQRGALINVRYAEGFRQHGGHSFPQKNILQNILQQLTVKL